MKRLVLVRHGQSTWNLENRFTGWVDVDVTDKGREEAIAAGQLLKAHGFHFDHAFTSVLKRAIRTCCIILDQLDQLWVPVTKDWRLNERHYGSLTGLDKTETAEKYGDEQVHIWRRSYNTPPPELSVDDPNHPRQDARYRHLAADELPATESLATTLERVLPYWDLVIAPKLREVDTVMIAAHGNSLRALIKHLDGLSDEEIIKIEIATGDPLVYEFDDNLKVTGRYYLREAPKPA
jgi:2,3-bisphosphoglycerate-dependent phosphoglycerate mutase